MELNNTEIKEKILKIEKDLSISAKGMAKFMDVTTDTYRKKKSSKELSHSFNVKNYQDLVSGLKSYINKLK